MYCVLLLIQEVTLYSRHFQLLDIICAKKNGHKLVTQLHCHPIPHHPFGTEHEKGRQMVIVNVLKRVF